MKNRLRMIMMPVLVGGILASVVTGVAQQEEKAVINPIDAAEANCLKTAHATMLRAKCYSAASDAWQKKVEFTYATLLEKLPLAAKEKLKKGQDAWVEYQAEEESLIVSLYPQRGSGHTAVRIIEIMQAYKARALELESHLQTVTGR